MTRKNYTPEKRAKRDILGAAAPVLRKTVCLRNRDISRSDA
jgi:hypothetical protein